MLYRSIILALTSVLPISAAPLSSDVIRIDDILTLNGTVLQFDPVNGLNDTTSNKDWQYKYFMANIEKINAIYQKQQNHGQILDQRDATDHVLAKRGIPECVRKNISFY